MQEAPKPMKMEGNKDKPANLPKKNSSNEDVQTAHAESSAAAQDMIEKQKATLPPVKSGRNTLDLGSVFGLPGGVVCYAGADGTYELKLEGVKSTIRLMPGVGIDGDVPVTRANLEEAAESLVRRKQEATLPRESETIDRGHTSLLPNGVKLFVRGDGTYKLSLEGFKPSINLIPGVGTHGDVPVTKNDVQKAAESLVRRKQEAIQRGNK